MAQNPSADRPSVRQFVRSRLRWQLWLLLFAAICAIVLSLTVLISRMMQRYARGTVIATSENLVYQGAQNLEIICTTSRRFCSFRIPIPRSISACQRTARRAMSLIPM